MVVVADSGRMRDRRNRAAARECLESSTARTTRVSCRSGCFTTRMEHGAIDAICREMLPNKNPRMSLNPRDPRRMRSAFTRRACRTIVRAMGPWAKTWWSLVLGPVAACPRATRADRSASRRRIPPAFSMAARARVFATGFLSLPVRRADGSTTWRSVTSSGSRSASASSACTPHREHSDPSTAQRIRMTDSLFLNDAKSTQVIPGISSALDVPVTHGNKEGESALFRWVTKRNGTPAPMEGAAFRSKEESVTVVIGVSCTG